MIWKRAIIVAKNNECCLSHLTICFDVFQLSQTILVLFTRKK